MVTAGQVTGLRERAPNWLTGGIDQFVKPAAAIHTWLALIALGAALLIGSIGPATADSTTESASEPQTVFEICQGQTYALCAVSSCFVFNDVAYCTCDVKHGDSISLPFNFDGKNVCDVNAAGAEGGYVVSTFSLPASVVKGGNMALYTCRGGVSDGAYAQCDGGLCFTSTQGAAAFPGSNQPLKQDQIVCSCPIVQATAGTPALGYQIAGPFPCEDDFFKNCNSETASTKTGSTIFVGAPTGTPRLLTRLLNGSVPPLNRCPAPTGNEPSPQ